MTTIATEADLRAVIGPEPRGLAEKNQPCLDAFAIEFIGKSPFLVLSTADREGRIATGKNAARRLRRSSRRLSQAVR